MEGFDTPNTAQMETVARDYSSPVVAWARKAGEYDDESTNGYAFWATLASGTRVLVGRYSAVLREEVAPICAHCGKPGAISEAHLDPSGESRCRTCLLASYGSAMREVAEYEPEILDDVHDSYAECGTPVNSSNLAGWRNHSRLCALRSVYEGAGIMAENGETGDAYVSLENAVGAYLRGADAPSITSAGFVS